VLNIFLSLRKATLGKAISCPTPVVNGQPNKKFTPQGCLASPNTLPRRKPDASKEKGIVCRPAAVPSQLISNGNLPHG
jgi:hypothetical protein